MKTHISDRGAAPIGVVSDLEPIAAGAVMYLRLWCDGPEAQSYAQQDFERNLGTDQGGKAAEALGTICDLCVKHGRRPLMRHALNCKCVGADESCFGHFIGYASEGAHEDALMIATVMVSPCVAPILVGLAQEFGTALRRMCVQIDPNGPANSVMH